MNRVFQHVNYRQKGLYVVTSGQENAGRAWHPASKRSVPWHFRPKREATCAEKCVRMLRRRKTARSVRRGLLRGYGLLMIPAGIDHRIGHADGKLDDRGLHIIGTLPKIPAALADRKLVNRRSVVVKTCSHCHPFHVYSLCTTSIRLIFAYFLISTPILLPHLHGDVMGKMRL